MSIVISVENLSKQYRLGDIGTGTLKDDVQRFWHKFRGKEDPFSQLGEDNDRTVAGSQAYVWALKDISFEIQQGEVLGIIGRNGAGKSTLLKILSRVTEPTQGRISITGRVASLLEVGTGMHPDLTGRENIYLNGAILGMRKKEIDRKFDAIVDFAGVARYIDTPVKRYSSGMHVRLGFAVAAHLDPEILIVDEVLAVGDVEFQQKCLGKMKDVSTTEGRTIIFVSHNLAAVQKLCSKGLVIQNGRIAWAGAAKPAIDFYLSQSPKQTVFKPSHSHNKDAFVRIVTLKGTQNGILQIGQTWSVEVVVELRKAIPRLVCAVGIASQDGIAIHTTWSDPVEAKPGSYLFEFVCDEITLASTHYILNVGVSDLRHSLHYLEHCIAFEMSEAVANEDVALINSASSGFVLNQMKTSIYPINVQL